MPKCGGFAFVVLVSVACASRSELGLLQKKTSTAKTKQAVRSCPLPEGGTWAEVRLAGLPAYKMAVRATDDLVSKTVLETGFWEVQDPSIWGPPGQALDIGGNIGYYTFALANAGWKVMTFEPMGGNQAFIEATLCENPTLAEKVTLHKFGLGTQNQACSMKVVGNNLGNGLVRCSEADVHDKEWEQANFLEAGSFQIRRLDEVLPQQHLEHVDFIKIDVEGYEGEVLKGGGAEAFLTKYQPRLIKSEAWKEMVRCTSQEYFAMFEKAGYRVSMDDDPSCKNAVTEVTKFWAAGANFYMCKIS